MPSDHYGVWFENEVLTYPILGSRLTVNLHAVRPGLELGPPTAIGTIPAFAAEWQCASEDGTRALFIVPLIEKAPRFVTALIKDEGGWFSAGAVAVDSQLPGVLRTWCAGGRASLTEASGRSVKAFRCDRTSCRAFEHSLRYGTERQQAVDLDGRVVFMDEFKDERQRSHVRVRSGPLDELDSAMPTILQCAPEAYGRYGELISSVNGVFAIVTTLEPGHLCAFFIDRSGRIEPVAASGG